MTKRPARGTFPTSKHQSIKASKHQSIKASKHQSIKASKHQSIKASKHQPKFIASRLIWKGHQIRIIQPEKTHMHQTKLGKNLVKQFKST
jgi:hypothetical protein